MKKLNKGFTLIELLAVIVILAIIALIATPIILGVVNDAEKSASISSSYGYVKAIEKEYMLNIVKENNIVFLTDEEMNILDNPLINIKVQGKKPSKGFLTLNEDGTVRNGNFCIDKYKVVYDGNTAKVVKGTCDNVIAGEIILTGDSIYDVAKILVHNNNTCKTDGTTYNYMDGCYIKGKSTNNYLWYSGFLWRIMGINADGTVRMISEDGIANVNYGRANSAEDYDNSYAKRWLNNYFLVNLKGANIIEEQIWCSERTIDQLSARTTCTMNLSKVNGKVGLISLDEYNLATAAESYLKNKQAFYSLTPVGVTNIFSIDYNGSISGGSPETSGSSMRPVINVRADAIVTAGNGTVNNAWTKDSAPYILNEKKISSKNTNKILNNITTVGEYVKLDNKTYRVVSKDSNGVKLIYDGYYHTMLSEYPPGLQSRMDTIVYEWLATNQVTKDKIITSDWNTGQSMWYGDNYQDTSMVSSNPRKNVKVGTIRFGEILSGYSQTIAEPQTSWTLTRSAYGDIWCINIQGKSVPVDTYNPRNGQYTFLYARPAIIVKNDLNITAGNGTPSNPYEI